MKNFYLIIFLVSSLSFGQLKDEFLRLERFDIEEGLKIHNQVRGYFDLSPYKVDSLLTIRAQEWAKHLAKIDSLDLSTDEYGENLFYVNKEYVDTNSKSIFTEATLNWLLENCKDDENSPYQQIKSGIATKIGVGFYSNLKRYYVVAKYDSIY